MSATLPAPLRTALSAWLPALARRGWGALLALLTWVGAVLGMALLPAGDAQAQTTAQVRTLYGPVSAGIAATGGRLDFFNDIHTYSRSPSETGPYRIVVDNSSGALTPGRGVNIEIWHNLQRVVTTADLFTAAGQPVVSVSKTIDTRLFLNLVIVKITGSSPVRLNWRIVAGQEPPPQPLLTAVSPNPLSISNGAAGVLNLSLAPAPSSPGQIQLFSSDPTVATAASSVPYSVGQSQVAVPVQGVGVGTANIRAELSPAGGTPSAISASVRVNPEPPRIGDITPAQTQIQQGANGVFRINVTPAQLQPVQITLSSSAPDTLRVPASTVLVPGQTQALFAAEALAVGNAQITAAIGSGAGASQAFSQVQVIPQPPRVVSLLPANSVLQQGSSASLTVTLSAAQAQATNVSLSSANPTIAAVPAQVQVPAGATQASFPVQGQGVGNTLVSASLGEGASASQVQAAVQVNPAPASIASLLPEQASLAQGAQTELQLRLNAAQSTPTTVTLASTPPGVVQVPAEVIVPAGQSQVSLNASALAVGQAQVNATLGTSVRSSTLTVTPQPLVLQSLLPNPLALQTGASGQLSLRLQASQPQATTVQLLSSDALRLSVPASVNVPAGQTEQTISVQALAAGSVTVSARATTASGAITSVQAVVNIAEPPPRIASLLPLTQNLPQGKVGTLRLSLDRAPTEATTVQISNTAPAVLGAPTSATVPAGQTGADIPVTALTQGSASLTATLANNGQTSSAQAVVQVTEPELNAIRLSPNPINVSAGQSVEVRATGTFSDGSERDISAEAATAWSVLDPSIASVSAQGRVVGQGPGSTTVQALQAVLPTHGNPSPQPVIGQAPVTVGTGEPLALSTPSSTLQVGQTAVVSITSPYAAASNPITITLQSTGTGSLSHPATASIGPGLTSVNVTVTATAAGSVTLSASAPQYAGASLSFTIVAAPPPGIAISAVAPNSAAPGASVRLTGSGFASPASANTVVFNGGAPAQVSSGSATELVVTVPAQAQSGAITVSNTVGGQQRSGQSPAFTVLREQDFGFTASPATLGLMQGSSASASLQLNSSGTQSFEGLARLTLTGLPTGVTAEFDPPSLSAVQTGRLLLKAANDAPLTGGPVTLTISAQATLGGLPWTRQSQLSVQVVTRTGVTAVKGRFVTPEGRPVAGVIVRQDTTTNQVTSDAAGNFFLQGLPAGTTTLRFDATPANPLYPIWPMNVSLLAGELRTYEDWVINPPPEAEKFKAINNATAEQRISDDRFPGFEVVLPAGATITGWDGVRKTRIAVERIMPDKLPVEQPPFVMKEAYQLYFGTPMGGIPSEPIPVTLPNVAELDPGEEVPIWWFDGSPMGGSGEWKLAGMGTVSEDGKTVRSNPGVGLPRFCGVCGLVSLQCDPPADPPEPPPTCPPPERGNPIDLFTGQEMPRTAGMSCGGQSPIELGWRYNPVDSFQNKAFTRASYGMGWTNAYDVVFLPFAGSQKRMIMPGGIRVNFVGSGGDLAAQHPLFQGVVARQIGSADTANSGTQLSASTLNVPLISRAASSFSSSSSSGGSSGGRGSVSVSMAARPSVRQGTSWEVLFKDGTRWIFEPYSGFTSINVSQFQRGGPPSWLTRVIDRNGNVTRISRSPSGKITRIEGSQGREFNMTLDAADHVSRITDHTGRSTQITYTEDHRIASMTDPEGRQTRYTYHGLPLYSGPYGISAYKGGSVGVSSSSSGSSGGGGGGISSGTVAVGPVACGAHIPWIKNPKSGSIAIDPPPRKYPLFSGLKEIQYPGIAQPTVNTYSTDRVLRQVASNGETRSFAYRRTGACVAKVSPGSQPYASVEEILLAYPSGALTPAPEQALFTCKAGAPYDTSTSNTGCLTGNCPPNGEQGMCPEVESEATHAAGWRFYGGTNTETIVTEPNGTTVRYRFNAKRLPIEYIDETGQSTKYEYDAAARLSKVIDPLLRETNVQYNGLGQLLSQSGPLGRRVDFAYHPDNQQRTQTTQYLAGVGSTQGGNSFSYTALTSSFNHDERGNLRSVRDPLGHTASLAYNDAGLLQDITLFALPNTTSLPIVRQGVGGPEASQIAASARKISAGYSSAGDLSRLSDALNQAITLDNDGLGRITRISDALSHSTQQQYDRTDLPTVTTDALGQTSRLEYDSAGRLSAVINAAGVTIERYDYDGRGRLTRITDAGNRQTTLEYDGASRLSAFVDRKGQRFTLSYDERNLVTAMSSPDRSIQASYDAIGRLTELRDASTSVLYRYDEADRVIEERTSTAAGQWSLGYEYDTLDRVTQRTLSGSALVTPEITTYQWDNASRLTQQLTRFGPEGSQSEHRTGYTYDAAARLQSRSSQITAGGTAEPTITQRYFYDEVERLSRIDYVQNAGLPSEQLIERIDYQYDARGQRIGKTTLNNNGTGATETPMDATYDAANRMQTITLKPSADVSTHKTYQLSYDANGNLTQKVNAANSSERTTYTWDAADKLIGLSQSEGGQTVTASFQYDLFGRRISSTIQQGGNAAQTVHYLYEGQQALGEIRNQLLSHRLITGLSLDETIARIAMVGTGNINTQASRQMLTDALNSVIAQANGQGGGVANSYGYSPYGQSQTVGPDATGNTAQYTSRENDGATGLYFYRARYYDPVLKRFISEDPIGLEGGDNVFAYVGGDPVYYTDPEGTLPIVPLAWAYTRCVLQCTAKSAAMQAFEDGGIDCIDPLETAGDCALQCLNPLNWAKGPWSNLRNKGIKHPSRKRAKEAAEHPHPGKKMPQPKKDAPKDKRDKWKDQEKYKYPERHRESNYPDSHFHDRNKGSNPVNNHHYW